MGVNLRVGPIAYPVGGADLFGSFFDTVGIRLEGGARGSRFPMLAALYRDGAVSPDAAEAARTELSTVESELRQHSPADAVWDIEKPGVLPPWGTDIADTITSLGDYFLTTAGRPLLTVMDAVFDASTRTGKPVRIA
ncbi:Imm70 family immunity protein [Microbacterium testaceum]|uniref:Imm70 family immunity protein n=1 Tax=Microbacterium testaceum TaxID=2033 RepID=UPI00243577C1|nr:Imm70 family immunity protein [Microbacterium testaceum]